MARFAPRSLRGRLVLLLTLAVAPALLTLTYERLDHRRQETEALRQTALALARLAAQAQERRLEGARQLLAALSRSAELDRDAQRCTPFVRGLIAEYAGRYTEIGWADASGRVICHALGGPENISIADRPYFQRVLASRTFVVGELMYGRLSGRPVLAFAYPKREASGEIVGVVFANIDLHALSDSLRGDIDGRDAVVYVLDRHGAGLARSERAEGWYGTRISEAQLAAITEHHEMVADFVGKDGVSRVYGAVSIRDGSGAPTLFVVVGLARDALVASANRRFRFDLLTVGILGAGLLLAAWIGSDRLIRRPVNHLLETTASLARGDLEARAPVGGGTREFEALAAAFNDMAVRLQQRDVSLRKGQRLEAIGELAGGIAHDFNNLLTVIVGYSESLREHLPANGVARTDLSELRTAAERAATLTRQLLAFSRQQVLQPRVLKLSDTVARLRTLLTRTIGDDIALVTIHGPDLGTVRADPTQVEQVLLNLVINARDALPDGGQITIETRNIEITVDSAMRLQDDLVIPAGPYVKLSVADTGVGMNAATRARIFEPFFTTKGPRGTGLGLATVYGIVKQSGGFITCVSEVGQGTTFSIFLPRTVEPPEPQARTRRVHPAGGQESILLVEDESAVRALVETVLKRAGYHVIAKADGAAATDWLATSGAVDLLLTDVKMPGMNGHTLADQARRARPHLPVLFISGYSKDTLPLAVDGDESIGFLAKPFTPFDLLGKVRQILDHQLNAVRRQDSGAVMPGVQDLRIDRSA
jgi:signal transduction histidine kinase/CheY-like chemotaxis protein